MDWSKMSAAAAAISGYNDLGSNIKSDLKNDKKDESNIIQQRLQTYLSVSRFDASEAKYAKFQPDIYLAKMTDLLQQDIKRKELGVEFISAYDSGQEEDEIIVSKSVIELHSQCRSSFSFTTATAIEVDSVGDDTIICLYALDIKSGNETKRVEFRQPSIIKSNQDDKDDPDHGDITFYHPIDGKIKFKALEPIGMIWINNDTKKNSKPKKKIMLMRSPLIINILFDYMSFEQI